MTTSKIYDYDYEFEDDDEENEMTFDYDQCVKDCAGKARTCVGICGLSRNIIVK